MLCQYIQTYLYELVLVIYIHTQAHTYKERQRNTCIRSTRKIHKQIHKRLYFQFPISNPIRHRQCPFGTYTHTRTTVWVRLTRSLKETCQERMNEKVVFECIQSVIQSVFALLHIETPQTCIEFDAHTHTPKDREKETHTQRAHTVLHTQRINDALSFIKHNRRFNFVD